jgi:eukaryotic-like serine/threonine-protein kinase
MASQPNTPDPRQVIGGHYVVEVAHPLPDAGGGIPAFSAADRRGGQLPLMAQRVDRDAPPRARALQMLATGIGGLLTPLAQGLGPNVDGRAAWFVICNAPTGPPVITGLRPWPESHLIEHVLGPIAHILEQLQSRGLTHRAIRPNNVFHTPGTHAVTLGAAWAAPPAMHQPAVFETPYGAICHRAGRGDGRIADDVYALGVLLATLAIGHVPMEGLDDAAVSYRKCEIGDFAAITGGERLPPMLGDIIRAMVAEDPEHRPPLAMLRDPSSVRGRRVAARPPSRAGKPFRLGPTAIWNNRTLAFGLATQPAEAIAAIQGGTLAHWLRRGLGDSVLAVKLEELVRHHVIDPAPDKEVASATMLMQAICSADIFMPLCWRGLAMFPDGLGSLLAAARNGDADLQRNLRGLVLTEAAGAWAVLREERDSAVPQRQEARQRRAILQIKGAAGGLPRLTYTLNPLIPCASKLLDGRWVVRAADLPEALDAIAAASKDAVLLDPEVVAFIAARSERSLDQEVQGLADDGDAGSRLLATLRLLSEMQNRFHPGPLPGLGSWIDARARPLVERWKNRERRAEVEERLKTLVAAGLLAPILALLEDRAGQAADADGLNMAVEEVARLDAELRGVTEGSGQRAAIAARLGQEIAAGLGVAAIALTLLLAAFG